MGTTLHNARRFVSAAVTVLRDSSRLDALMTGEEIISEAAFRRLCDQMRRSASGRELLRERPEISRATVDYDALRQSQPGTLGRAYVDFLDSNGITPDVMTAPVLGIDDPEVAWVLLRWRQIHDLCHMLTGIGVGAHEEVLIQAFHFGQAKVPLPALIVLFGAIKHMALEGRWRALRRALPAAYAMGRDAAPLHEVFFERRWGEPVDALRRELGVRTLDPALVG